MSIRRQEINLKELSTDTRAFFNLHLEKYIGPIKGSLNEQEKREAILNLQGCFIEIEESDDVIGMMRVLDLAFEYAEGCVLKLKNGEKYLVFDHSYKLYEFQRFNINTTVGGCDMVALKENLPRVRQTLTIDLEDIWASQSGSLQEKVNLTINAIKKRMQVLPTDIEIIGVPNLLLVSVIRHLADKQIDSMKIRLAKDIDPIVVYKSKEGIFK